MNILDRFYSDTARRLKANWDREGALSCDLITRLEEMDSGDKIRLSGIERDLIIYALADKLDPTTGE